VAVKMARKKNVFMAGRKAAHGARGTQVAIATREIQIFDI